MHMLTYDVTVQQLAGAWIIWHASNVIGLHACDILDAPSVATNTYPLGAVVNEWMIDDWMHECYQLC